MRQNAGFSLLELLITLVIISSFIWLGLSLFSPKPSLHRVLKSEAHRLEVFIQEAHTDALILNTPVIITPDHPNHWEEGLVLKTLSPPAPISPTSSQKILARFPPLKSSIRLTYQGFPLNQSIVFYPTPTLQNSNGRFTLRSRTDTLSLILNKSGQLTYAS